MANFVVSYKFKAVDQFSAFARKAKSSADRLGRSMNGLAEKTKKASRNFKQFGKEARLAGAKMTAVATLPIALLGRGMIRSARDAEEARSKFNTVFKDISDSSNSMADSIAKSYGLANTESRVLLGNTGDLLTGFGFSQESALDLSADVQKLAVDLASFTNIEGGASRASKALTSALLGEREAVKSLGISILEEDVKARVKQLVVVEKMKFATERQAKAFATLQIATEQSKNAIGDFARTSDSLANRQRILAANTQNMAEKYGNLLLPIATKVTNGLIRLANWMEKLSPTTKKAVLFTAALVAIGGPLLIMIGAISTAIPFVVAGFAAISAPVWAVVAAFAAAYAIGTNLANNLALFPALYESIGAAAAKVAGVFGFGEDTPNLSANNKKIEQMLSGSVASTTDINVNLNAPKGTVGSVRSRSRGRSANVGVASRDG